MGNKMFENSNCKLTKFFNSCQTQKNVFKLKSLTCLSIKSSRNSKLKSPYNTKFLGYFTIKAKQKIKLYLNGQLNNPN